MRRLLAAASLVILAALAQESGVVELAKIVDGLQFTAGPAWSPQGFLVFSDVPSSRQYRLLPSPGEIGKREVSVSRDSSGGACGNAFDSKGRLYSCETHNRRVVRADRDKMEVLADRWEGRRFNSPHNIVVRADGHIWFTDPAFGSAADRRELNFDGVFHISPKRELSVVAKWHNRPCGIALSPEGNVLYVSDADAHTVHAFGIDHNGTASREQTLISGVEGVPTGLCVDGGGQIYVAARALDVYDRNGKRLRQIELNTKPSACAFAEDGSVYVTARSAVFRIQLKQTP